MERTDFGLERSHTTRTTLAFLMYDVAKLAYLSCPAVSQICSYLPLMQVFRYETLIVGA